MKLWQSAATGWASEGPRQIHFPRKCWVCLSDRDGQEGFTTSLLKNVHRPPILAEFSPSGFVEMFSGSCCIRVADTCGISHLEIFSQTCWNLSFRARTRKIGDAPGFPAGIFPSLLGKKCYSRKLLNNSGSATGCVWITNMLTCTHFSKIWCLLH